MEFADTRPEGQRLHSGQQEGRVYEKHLCFWSEPIAIMSVFKCSQVCLRVARVAFVYACKTLEGLPAGRVEYIALESLELRCLFCLRCYFLDREFMMTRYTVHMCNRHTQVPYLSTYLT